MRCCAASATTRGRLPVRIASFPTRIAAACWTFAFLNAASKSSGFLTSSSTGSTFKALAAIFVSSPKRGRDRISQVIKKRNSVDLTGHLFEQFEPLCSEVNQECAQPRYVSAWARETGDQARPYRITTGCHHDWDDGGRILGGKCCWRPPCDKDINVLAQWLGRKRSKLLNSAAGKTVADHKVLTVNISELL